METDAIPLTIEIKPSGAGDREVPLTAYVRANPFTGHDPVDFYFDDSNDNWTSTVIRIIDALANPNRYRLRININRLARDSINVPTLDEAGDVIVNVTHYNTRTVDLIIN